MTNLSHSSSENNGQPRSEFPKGLRVLVIDDDLTDLNTVGQFLRQCQYNVTVCPLPKKALDILRERNREFDVVLCDVYMPDMDGFQLLENIKSEMNVPVIMMSAEDEKDLVVKLFNYGACYHLTKPVSLEAVMTIRKHLIKRKSNELKGMNNSMSMDVSDKQKHPLENADNASLEKEGNWEIVKREREQAEVDELDERESLCSVKKSRVVWTPELREKFVGVVEQLGVEKAVPKKILELMNDPGLTRENVASHLQKYRLNLKRSHGIQQQARSTNVAFPPFVGAPFNPINSFDGYGFQTLAASGERPQEAPMTVPRMADQRVVFNPEAQLTRPTMVKQVNINQMNLVAAPIIQPCENTSLQVGAGAQGLVRLPSSLRTNSSFPDRSFNDMTNSYMMQMNPRLVPFESNMGQLINYGDIPRPLNPNIQNNIPNESNFHPQVNSWTEASAGSPIEDWVQSMLV